MSVRVLVADDEPGVRFAVRDFLQQRGWRVTEASSAAELWQQVEREVPDVVLLDFRLPDATALEILPTLRERFPWLPVIVLTAFGSIELAVQAIQFGAKQFLTKPVDLATLAALIERVDSERQAEAIALTARATRGTREPDPFVGSSEAIRRVEAAARKIARSDAAVSLLGETGTGKGVLARWIHAHGPRATAAFVDINCAGLGGDLLQAELFGYEKGAFTGATDRKLGLVELAHRGTLFLDEIGDLDPAVQAKLLKVLEEKRFRRVGGVVDLQVDIRLISATHRDLRKAVERGSFRADLYYRIGVVSLELPPLRDRRDDIPALVEKILRQFPPPQGAPLWELGPGAIELLLEYDWPGNIRELRNVLERVILLTSGTTIDAQDLAAAIGSVSPGETRATTSYEPALSLAEVEKRHILRVLDAVGGDVAKAAEQLGLPRSTLYQRLRRYGVRPKARQATPGG